MIEIGLSDLLGVDHDEIEPISRASESEADQAFRARVLTVAGNVDKGQRSTIAAATGSDLDAIGLRYGLRRFGAFPGIDGPSAA